MKTKNKIKINYSLKVSEFDNCLTIEIQLLEMKNCLLCLSNKHKLGNEIEQTLRDFIFRNEIEGMKVELFRVTDKLQIKFNFYELNLSMFAKINKVHPCELLIEAVTRKMLKILKNIFFDYVKKDINEVKSLKTVEQLLNKLLLNTTHASTNVEMCYTQTK